MSKDNAETSNIPIDVVLHRLYENLEYMKIQTSSIADIQLFWEFHWIVRRSESALKFTFKFEFSRFTH